METTSIGIYKWAHPITAELVWESGVGDSRLRGWERADGSRAIETNGDPFFEGFGEFDDMWNAQSLRVG